MEVRNLGQVNGDVEIMVEEIGILFWVKQLEQCRRRVTLVATTHLVYLANNNSYQS